ncbi:hypothetical protein RO3G_14805 [Rhizopus delemar RA 99-880]|uniref:Uncharacterized protein n=1 Tax=Rhizopus delemar (strain RA 99-880 / ATCC MYA-4621 / FGSC 9543 / NRRL 43880) TaxID=246409 RepID=I1CNR4_RHIO9|nr:hypothetical protein RO3G_14805 [Rhizopus delemar RA 99-880]|eukprot:EIE90094.1 hypothetical protein RO3G_14805 [Rhizopus delemar RA 99-880]
MITNACNISEQHVFLGGATLGNLNSKDIKPILDKCIQVEYNADLVEEVYHNSCICQGINDIPTSSKNSCICQSTNNIPTSSNKNSVKDMNVSPSALSFYAERQEHLIGEIKQREKTLSRKRQEMDTANNW